MQEPSRPLKIGTIIWSVLLSIGAIALGVSVLLPSTKRARFDFKRQQEMNEQNPATLPASQPTTQL